MMEVSEIKTEVNLMFRDIFDDESIQIHDAMTAADVEEWDSLNHINLIVATEKKFGIKFTTGEISQLENVGQFLNLIAGKLS